MIELLITESFSGVDYDFSFPCPDCYDNRSIDSEMSMFSASLVRRATQARAVFLQCRNRFHVTPMTDLHSRMPPDSVDAYDMQLYGSVRELKHLKYIYYITIINSQFYFNNYYNTVIIISQAKVRLRCGYSIFGERVQRFTSAPNKSRFGEIGELALLVQRTTQ